MKCERESYLKVNKVYELCCDKKSSIQESPNAISRKYLDGVPRIIGYDWKTYCSIDDIENEKIIEYLWDIKNGVCSNIGEYVIVDLLKPTIENDNYEARKFNVKIEIIEGGLNFLGQSSPVEGMFNVITKIFK